MFPLLTPSELPAQPTQGKSGEKQPKVAQRNVEVPGYQQQIDYDHCQPGGDDVSENFRFKRNANSRNNLDHAHDEHERVRGYGRDVRHRSREVLIPIHHEVKEFIQSREDGGNYESELQDPICLISG